MAVLMYPPPDVVNWPTLGPQVCGFIEQHLVYGPGDLFGKPVELNDEQRAWIYRMYEVEPQQRVTWKGGRSSRSTNPRAGKRRFERCVLSLRKGSSKTELAAWIAICELHADGPVRCVGFHTVRGVPGEPIGGGVTDPYIPMISYTEEQTTELAYGALRRILEESDLAGDFDIGLERVLRRDGQGKCEAVAGSPNARDGARTTFVHADESHRWTLPSLKQAWIVSLANLGKRPLADPWALETTTAPEPGGGSVGETTMDFAMKLIASPPAKEPRFFFYHREASGHHDLATEAGLEAAILEASGPYIAQWTDTERIARRFRDDDADQAYAERVWLNRRVQATDKAFDVDHWRTLARIGYAPAVGAAITIGFDGSRFHDATGLVGTEVATGFQFVLGLWERPETLRPNKEKPEDTWRVDRAEVDTAVHSAFEQYAVLRMYCDPPNWEEAVAAWAGKYGKDRVLEWWTNRPKPMVYAVKGFIGAMLAGEICHSGSKRLTAHIGNACRANTNFLDDAGNKLFMLRKERPDSPHKIDLSMASILSWEARNDAITAGEAEQPQYDVYIVGGV